MTDRNVLEVGVEVNQDATTVVSLAAPPRRNHNYADTGGVGGGVMIFPLAKLMGVGTTLLLNRRALQKHHQLRCP